MRGQYTRRTILTIAAGALGAVAIAPVMGRRGTTDGGAVLGGPTMGTSYRVTIPRLPAGVSREAVRRQVREVLDHVDATMSTYRPDSEVSRFNRAEPGVWIPVSAGTSKVAAAAIDMAWRTEGAFDPTIGPLVDLWGFGSAGPFKRVPDAGSVAAVRNQIGYPALEERRESPALRKRKYGLQIDLSGIAEGFAADELAGTLDHLSIPDFLIELGGEVRCRGGSNPAGRPWTIAVELPHLAATRPQRYVALADAAVATSGDYRKFFIVDGRRYSHLIDPRTGEPVNHDLASVTVIAGSAMQADALSTALLVMGSEAGFAFAERHRIAALFIARGEDGFGERMTVFFNRYVTEQPA